MDAIVQINMDNAAFEAPATELGRILRDLAGKIEHGDMPEEIKLRDYNGNSVGSFVIKT